MLTFLTSTSQVIVADLIEKDEWVRERVAHELSLMSNDTSVLNELQLNVLERDIVDGTTKEIGFTRFRTMCDSYGLPINNTREAAIVGAWINHGSIEEPKWGSHT